MRPTKPAKLNVRMIVETRYDKLEDAINHFFETTILCEEVLDIKYQESAEGFSALIIYTDDGSV